MQELMTVVKASVSNSYQLNEVVDMIFDTALLQHIYLPVYADACVLLNQVDRQGRRKDALIESVNHYISQSVNGQWKYQLAC